MTVATKRYMVFVRKSTLLYCLTVSSRIAETRFAETRFAEIRV